MIFVTARVHPGETPASFVSQGLVDWLLGTEDRAVQLRRGTTVVVVPMLNPDGVFLGNYRYDPPPPASTPTNPPSGLRLFKAFYQHTHRYPFTTPSPPLFPPRVQTLQPFRYPFSPATPASHEYIFFCFNPKP